MTPTDHSPNVAWQRDRRLRTWAALAAILAACMWMSSLRAAPARAPWSPRVTAGSWIGGQPLIPPPHLTPLLPHFFALLHSYAALDADAKIPFAVWVVGNGVTDPDTLRGMMELYVWYQPWLRGSA